MDQKKGIKIAPSLLSADFTRLGDEVRDVMNGGGDYIHVDVMDGMFVPNISIGLPVLKSLRKAFPEVFLDVHLMIEKPVRFVKAFADAGADSLTFHIESDSPENIDLAIAEARQRGVKTGLALKPQTKADAVAPWLPSLDTILVMTVEPGFGGQRFMAEQLPKLRELSSNLNRENPLCVLGVDGGIDEETAPLVIEAGADALVAGNAIFSAPDRTSVIRRLRG